VLADYVTADQISKLEKLQTDAANAAAISRNQDQPTLSALTWTAHLMRTYQRVRWLPTSSAFYLTKLGMMPGGLLVLKNSTMIAWQAPL